MAVPRVALGNLTVDDRGGGGGGGGGGRGAVAAGEGAVVVDTAARGTATRGTATPVVEPIGGNGGGGDNAGGGGDKKVGEKQKRKGEGRGEDGGSGGGGDGKDDGDGGHATGTPRWLTEEEARWFPAQHECSKHYGGAPPPPPLTPPSRFAGPAARAGTNSSQIAQTFSGKVHFLTVATVLGGWVHLDMVREWVVWHTELGADNFVLYLVNADAQLERLLESLRDQHGFPLQLVRKNMAADFWNSRRHNDVLTAKISRFFREITNKMRGQSEWVAFVDVDEFISPGEESTGLSFPHWLASLPPAADKVYLRWVYFPVPNYSREAFFEAPVTHSHTYRFKDSKIATHEVRNSGKSIIKPKFFSGINSVHHFEPREWSSYDSAERNVVPTSKLDPKLPFNCNAWETMYGRNGVKNCHRTPDVFMLGHYRRRSPPNGATNAVTALQRNNPSMWPVDQAYGYNFVGRDTCTLMAATCRRLNETKALSARGGVAGAGEANACLF